MRLLPSLFAVCATALAATACTGGATAPERAAAVTMRDVTFEPGTITVRMGERLRLDLRNQGAVAHDFTIETMPMTGRSTTGGMTGGEHGHAASQFAMHLALSGGASGIARFTPSKPGEYPYICTVPGHREAGMRGTIRVE